MLETKKKPQLDIFTKIRSESLQRNRISIYDVRPPPRVRTGGSHSRKSQKGGCQKVHTDPYINFDGLFGDNYEIFNHEPEITSSDNQFITIPFDIQPTQPPQPPQNKFLHVNIMNIPFIQFWTLALLSSIPIDHINYMFNYITGKPFEEKEAAIDTDELESDTTAHDEDVLYFTSTLYDIVCEYIVFLRIQDEENRNKKQIKFEQAPPVQDKELVDIYEENKKSDTTHFKWLEQYERVANPYLYSQEIELDKEEHIKRLVPSVLFAESDEAEQNILDHVFLDNLDSRRIYGQLIFTLIEINLSQYPEQPLLYNLCRLMNGGLDTDADYSQLTKEPLEISAKMAAVSISISTGRPERISQSPNRNGGMFNLTPSPYRDPSKPDLSQQSFEPESQKESLQFPSILTQESDTSSQAGSESRSIDFRNTVPFLSLETVSEAIDTLLNVGYGIDNAKEDMLMMPDGKETSILFELHRIKDIINGSELGIPITSGLDIHFIIYRLIPLIVENTIKYIDNAVESLNRGELEARELEAAAAAEPPISHEMSVGNAGDPEDEEAGAAEQEEEVEAGAAEQQAAQAQQEEVAALREIAETIIKDRTADAFKQAEEMISRLKFASETTIFIGYLCKCCEVLYNFGSEYQLIGRRNFSFDDEYQFIRSMVVEPSSASSSLGSFSQRRASGGGTDNYPVDPRNLAATTMTAPTMRSEGGRRSTPKKSTHRKPRRHTRNYQSHNNKRKQHSSKKSTIKHRKSYRKHNRTIKRRKNSRRHHQ